MSEKMSSDETDTKTVEEESKENSKVEENGDSDVHEEKVNNKTASKKKGADPPKIKQPAKKRMKTEQAEKESKKEDKKAKEEEEDGEEENEESEEENDVDKAVPLLDQPLEVEGSRRRKEVQRFVPPNPEEDNKEVQIPAGKGKALGDIEIIDFHIQKARTEDLKLLHRLCFSRQCRAALLKKNIRKFNGYDFEEASDEYERRKTILAKNKKITVSGLKNIVNILDVEKKNGTKDEILERILSFLANPVDLGKKLPGVGRSKRTGASAKNYNEGDEKFSSKKKSKSKKKSEESEGSEKEDTDDESDKKEKKTEKKNNHSKVDEEESKVNDEEQEEDEEKEEEEEEEVEEKPKKGGKKGKKAAEKKAPPKKRAAAKKAAEKSESEKEEEEESEDDEPLAKVSKTPPTDEEIKLYVKSLLDGANLELITMKKVCHDVYAHYPDFDLGHKKDFIKTTVKSLIAS